MKNVSNSNTFVIADLIRNLFSRVEITGRARNDVKRLIIFLAILLNFSAFATSYADPNIKFKEANTLYAAGKYEEAVKIYDELIKDDYLSPEIYTTLEMLILN